MGRRFAEWNASVTAAIQYSSYYFKMVFPQKQQIARPPHGTSPGPLERSRGEDSFWF
jgi:hypothetical protein